MTKKKIPNFQTLDEAVNFWETNSFAAYADDTEAVSVTVNLPPNPETLQIELTPPLARQIQTLAQRKHTTPSRLVEEWVKEQLAKAT